MLALVKRWVRSRYAPVLPPPHDPYAGWERIVGMAADAWPVELVERLTFEQAAEVLGQGTSWETLKAAQQPGDELWRFRSPDGAWRARCGRAGVLLTRKGITVCTVVTVLS